MHPFAYLREIRSYVEGHGCRRPSPSQIWRFCKEAKLTLKTVSSASFAAARDFYMADSPQGTRWYFVRVNTAG